MKKLAVYIFLFCFYQWQCIAQNAEQDFERISTNMMSTKDMVIETEYKVFANHFTQTPEEISHGLFKQNGGSMIQNLASVRTLVNKNISIHIDTTDKILVVSNPVKLEEQRKEALLFDIRKNFSKYKAINYSTSEANVGTYHIEFKEDVETEFDKCEIRFDKKTFLPLKLILYYNEEMDIGSNSSGVIDMPRLEITFLKIETKPKFNESEFDENKYVQISGNKIFPTPSYKGFRIIDNRY